MTDAPSELSVGHTVVRILHAMRSHGATNHCHRSHFGSRYTSGCCDLAGLFVTLDSFLNRQYSIGVEA